MGFNSGFKGLKLSGDWCAACVSFSFQHSTSNEEEFTSYLSLVLTLKYRLTKLSPSFWITLYFRPQTAATPFRQTKYKLGNTSISYSVSPVFK